MKLKVLKTYIKINLTNGFIWPFKSLVDSLIIFVKKLDKSLWLCIDNKNLNNLSIQNWYSLPLIGKSLDQLSWAKRFK